MVANERVAGRWYQGARASEKFDRRHESMSRAAAPSHLDLVGDPAVRQTRKPFESEAGAERVAVESFATLDVGGRDADASVKVKTAVFGSEALLAAVPARVVVIAQREGRARRAKSAQCEGYLRAAVEWRQGFSHVRTVFPLTLVEESLASEPANDARGDSPDDPPEIIHAWRFGRLKARHFVVEHEGAIEPDDVKVGIQVQASAESLDAGDGAGPRGRDARAPDIVGRHNFVEDASGAASRAALRQVSYCQRPQRDTRNTEPGPGRARHVTAILWDR